MLVPALLEGLRASTPAQRAGALEHIPREVAVELAQQLLGYYTPLLSFEAVSKVVLVVDGDTNYGLKQATLAHKADALDALEDLVQVVSIFEQSHIASHFAHLSPP